MNVDLSKLVKRADRAMKDVTPGPWHTEGDAPWNLTVWSSASNRVCFMAHSNGLNDDRDMATGAFIASARDLVEEMTEALTTLLAERDAAVARAEKAEGALRWVEANAAIAHRNSIQRVAQDSLPPATEEGEVMTWLQKRAWEEVFRLLSRPPSQIKKMGFSSLGDAATFEFRRVAALSKTEKVPYK